MSGEPPSSDDQSPGENLNHFLDETVQPAVREPPESTGTIEPDRSRPAVREELLRLEGPHAKLAWLVDEYLRRTNVAPEESPVLKELKQFRLDWGDAVRREDQIRTYCELACCPAPTDIVRKFPIPFLYRAIPEFLGWHDQEIDEHQSPERYVDDVLFALGFPRPPQVDNGLSAYTLRWEQGRQFLQGKSRDREKMLGVVLQAYNDSEIVLQNLISFYSRFLFGPDYIASLRTFLSKAQMAAIEKWKAGKWQPDVGDLLPVLKGLNAFVAGSADEATRFRDTFNRGEIISDDLLNDMAGLWSRRADVVAHGGAGHGMTAEDFRNQQRVIMEQFLSFAERIKETVFPPVVILLREIVLGSGQARIDFIDDRNQLRHARFLSGPIPFASQTELFYFQPRGSPLEEEDIEPVVFGRPPILIPVNETFGGQLE
jgi:hypothetical protein